VHSPNHDFLPSHGYRHHSQYAGGKLNSRDCSRHPGSAGPLPRRLVVGWVGKAIVFEQIFSLEAAIGSHACSLARLKRTRV
jgi:hypothetical protein